MELFYFIHFVVIFFEFCLRLPRSIYAKTRKLCFRLAHINRWSDQYSKIIKKTYRCRLEVTENQMSLSTKVYS